MAKQRKTPEAVPAKTELPEVVQLEPLELATLENLVLKLNNAVHAHAKTRRQCEELQHNLLHKRGQISERLGGLDLSRYTFDNQGKGVLKKE